ncbi:LacI family DNA-binding transcriptional regulator [Rubricoccus marinus]|uniref:HTH lacI-type domain-containing protein n=1 Tax=Rubricoccus marinus TaxID=716817 RepID=A0A259TVP0_9BACT|nr:LacI family DNA-binding transcriptional regulator [Rubricoccus marinus]OZC01791.1 hypothetical protein BSZ36_01585 [Rubricoccus marinus]
MKRVTIKDIARLLSVAPSTVSRALADHPDIGPETKARVREAAKALNYIPNLRARYLRSQHSRLVALIVPEVNMFFVPSLMTGVDHVLRENDYSLLLFESDDSIVQERKLAQLCLNLSVDGVLLARSSETTELSHLDALADADLPVVLLDKILDTDRYSTVSTDGRDAARRATGYLLDRGHERVLGVFADDRQRISVVRAEGFRQAFAERDLPLAESAIVHVRHLAEFEALVGRAMDAHPDATGLFAMSDELLVRSYHAVLARGRAIPDDVSLVAISDGRAPEFLFPRVTHLLHSGKEVGQKAAHILVGMMRQHYAGAALAVTVRTELVEHESVRVIGAEVG